jgi:hypothetical protein
LAEVRGRVAKRSRKVAVFHECARATGLLFSRHE